MPICEQKTTRVRKEERKTQVRRGTKRENTMKKKEKEAEKHPHAPLTQRSITSSGLYLQDYVLVV